MPITALIPQHCPQTPLFPTTQTLTQGAHPSRASPEISTSPARPARIALPGSLVMLRAMDKNNSDSIVLLFIHGKVNQHKGERPLGQCGG